MEARYYKYDFIMANSHDNGIWYLGHISVVSAAYFNAIYLSLRLRGKSRMPVVIVLMAVIFNLCNALMQGGWLFYFAPEGRYGTEWLLTPQFIIGCLVFLAGMVINIHSDHIIRNLRKKGDNSHYCHVVACCVT
jgi:hypothetical protein